MFSDNTLQLDKGRYSECIHKADFNSLFSGLGKKRYATKILSEHAAQPTLGIGPRSTGLGIAIWALIWNKSSNTFGSLFPFSTKLTISKVNG